MTTLVSRSAEATSSADATSNHCWTVSALTGGAFIVMTRMPSARNSLVTADMETSRSHNQALAWYCISMALSLDLNGQVVLVTGGQRGIGRGITAAFSDA